MSTNEGWPEAFGFTIEGDAPVYIAYVEEEGVAQQAGLLAGDIIVELNGENVRRCSKIELIALALQSQKVPPSLIVLSRLRTVTLQRRRTVTFGITVRGDAPVYIRTVEFDSPAREVGLRSGDLVLEIDGVSVRYSSKYEVLELMNQAGLDMTMVVVAAGGDLRTNGVEEEVHHAHFGPSGRMEKRYSKAKSFHQQMQYYLIGENIKKTNLVTLLRLYAKDHNVDNFGQSVALLLETPTERKLLPFIRNLLHPSHQAKFDSLVCTRSSHVSQLRRGSQPALQQFQKAKRSLSASQDPTLTSSLPDLFEVGNSLNQVTIERRLGEGFGFTISGNAPVFIKSVDKGGAAERIGLRSGDYILEINGLSVRNGTHSQVVNLLKGSGTSPSLLVCQVPHPKASRNKQPRIAASAAESPHARTRASHKRQSLLFKSEMHKLLRPEEEQFVIQKLDQFSTHRDVDDLVKSLVPVLNDSEKAVLLHQICQLLPSKVQDEFDETAANVLSEDHGVAADFEPSLLPTESVTDIISRVQSDQLPQSSLHRQRGFPSSYFDRREHPRNEAIMRALSSGQKFGSDLDLLPVKDEKTFDTSSKPSHNHRYSEISSDDSIGIDEDLFDPNPKILPGPSHHRLEDGPTLEQNNSPLSRSKGFSKHPAELTSVEQVLTIDSVPDTERDEETFDSKLLGRGPDFVSDNRAPQSHLGLSKAVDNARSGKDIVRALAEKKRNQQAKKGQTKEETLVYGNISGVSVASSIPPPPPPMPTPSGSPAAPPPPAPPPPLMGAAGESMMQLKKVNWEKLSGSNIHGTVWSQLSNSTLQDALEYVDLEENFKVQPSKGATKRQGPTKAGVLSQKKAYNISILLGHLKLPNETIKRAVLECDESILSIQHLKQMEAFAPSKTECAAYAKYMNNPSELSVPDKFTCEMSTIPSYSERLRAMIFKIDFQDKVKEIKPDLESISKASHQLQDSKSFKAVLQLILSMGNHLNVGNNRIGNAAGFRISFLGKLRSTRTSDNQSTLLHYLIKTVQKKFPNLECFPDQIASVTAATRVSNQTLNTEIEELQKGITEIKQELEVVSSSEVVQGDQFIEIMSSFIEKAARDLQTIVHLQRTAMQDYRQVAKYFGEDPHKMRSDDFFAAFAGFITDYQTAVSEIETEKKKDNHERKKSVAEIIKERKMSATNPQLPAGELV